MSHTLWHRAKQKEGKRKKKSKGKKEADGQRGERLREGKEEVSVCMHTKRVGPSTEGAKPPSLPFAKATARHPGPIFPGHARHI